MADEELDDRDWYCQECFWAKVSFGVTSTPTPQECVDQHTTPIAHQSIHLSPVFEALSKQNPEAFHLPRSLKQKMANTGLETTA